MFKELLIVSLGVGVGVDLEQRRPFSSSKVLPLSDFPPG